MDKNTPTPRMQTIENATRDDVLPGDHLTWTRVWERDGVTAKTSWEGIAHRRGDDDDWWTKGGMYITNGEGEGITLTIRRPVQDVPTEPGTVLDPADGREYITATVGGVTYRAREAILLEPDHWHAAWRSDEGVLPYVISERIDPGIWQVGPR